MAMPTASEVTLLLTEWTFLRLVLVKVAEVGLRHQRAVADDDDSPYCPKIGL